MKTKDLINFIEEGYQPFNQEERKLFRDYMKQVRQDLLAQKEDRKECKHRWVGVTTIDGKKWCEIHDNFEQFIPTPSPLEIEEIEETSQIDLKDVHKLIRNQKKLYQYIKEKKI